MNPFKTKILPILLSTIWIVTSEFVRNELLFKQLWIEHYQALGIIFPSEPINGIVWVIWSLISSVLIFKLYQKFSFWETITLAWVFCFILMWLVIGNLNVLPYRILYFAIPLSFLEVLLAGFIIHLFNTKKI
ncbi:MAG: hypothetical protein JXR60_05190 [Bacteroidales bacterium]|nr:hypothetical protein [Bacteroidales bacterium]